MGNLTNSGSNAIASLVSGDGSFPAFDTSNGHVGVGDSSTAFSATQTDLQAPTNKLRKALDSAPARTNNSVDYTATFGLTEGNFAWNEVGVFNGATGNTMLARKVVSLGTKPGTETWTITATVVYTPV